MHLNYFKTALQAQSPAPLVEYAELHLLSLSGLELTVEDRGACLMLCSPHHTSALEPHFKKPDWNQPFSVHKRLLGSQGLHCCDFTWR